jgi:VanZ family protein
MTEGVRRGTKNYHVPRAIFFYHDQNAKSMFHLSHGIMNLRKDQPWKHYCGVFPVPAEAQDARLHIQNYGSDGKLCVDNISIRPVIPRKSVAWWGSFFGALWLLTFGYWFFILHPWKRRYGILVTLTCLIILAGIVMPQTLLDDGIQAARKQMRHIKNTFISKPHTQTVKSASLPPSAPTNSSKKSTVKQPDAEKHTVVERVYVSGHFLLFGLLAFLSLLCWGELPFLFSRVADILGGLILFAISSEILQMITLDREAGWNDLLVDLIGIAGAALLASLLQIIQSAFNRKSS